MRPRVAIVAAVIGVIALLLALRDREGARVRASAADVEGVLGAPVPESADRETVPAEPGAGGDGSESEEAHVLVPPREGTLTVRIVEDATGRPLPGASVGVHAFSGRLREGGVSGPDGRVTFPGAGREAYVVEVAPPEGLAEWLRGVQQVVRGFGPHEIRLRTGPVLIVHVRDETGATPRGSVLVGWSALDRSAGRLGPDRSGRRRLAADGSARLVVCDAPVSIRVCEWDATRLAAWAWIKPVDPTSRAVTVVLPRCEPLRLRFLDARTGEAPSARVDYRVCRQGDPFGWPCAEGIGRGEPMETHPLPPGDYDVYALQRVRDDTGILRCAWGEARGVAPGEDPVVVELVPGRPVAGCVTGPDGRPPAEQVWLSATLDDEDEDREGMAFLGTVPTAEDGRFRFEELPPRPLRIDFVLPATAAAVSLRTGAAGQEDVSLELVAASTLRGRIRWEGWCGPYDRYDGEVRADVGWWVRPSRVRVDGSFELDGVAPGPVSLSWWAGGVKIADLGVVSAPADGVVLRVAAP